MRVQSLWPHLRLFQATRQFLEEINKWTSQHGVSPLSRELAVKFLMARKFDVLRAIELFHSYRVRKDERTVSIKTDIQLLTYTAAPSDSHAASPHLINSRSELLNDLSSSEESRRNRRFVHSSCHCQILMLIFKDECQFSSLLTKWAVHTFITLSAPLSCKSGQEI